GKDGRQGPREPAAPHGRAAGAQAPQVTPTRPAGDRLRHVRARPRDRSRGRLAQPRAGGRRPAERLRAHARRGREGADAVNTEWVYVIELAPSGHVKVGRTSKLASRINAHVANAGFGGSSVARVFSVACTNAATVERALLDHLTARQ